MLLTERSFESYRSLWAGKTVLLVAPGPSSREAVTDPYDMVVACNLSVLTVKADLWVVVDKPSMITPPERLSVFREVDPAIPLACPSWSRGEWGERQSVAYFEVVDPHHVRYFPNGTQQKKGLPMFPWFGGCPTTAAALALYAGANRLILSGVDYTSERTPNAEKSGLIRQLWLRMQREFPRCEFVQTNPESLVQFA